MSKELRPWQDVIVPYNNLDLLDERGTPGPDVEIQGLLNGLQAMPTLDERYADATPEELGAIARASFFEGYGQYLASIPEHRTTPVLNRLGLLTPDQLAINSLLYFGGKLGKEYRKYNPNATMMDRVQNANVHIVERAKDFDISKGVGLIPIINPFFIRRVKRAERGGDGEKQGYLVSDGPLIRIPQDRGNQAYHQLEAFHRSLEGVYGRKIPFDEFGDLGKVPPYELRHYKKYKIEHIPFHRLVEAENRDEAVDFTQETIVDDGSPPDPFEVTAQASHDGLKNALQLLDEKERQIITARFGLDGHSPETRAQLADDFNVCYERIRQIEAAALKKLKLIPDIIDIINEVIEPPDPVSLRPAEPVQLELETDLVRSTRLMLNGHHGILATLRRRGVDLGQVIMASGLHPHYARDKIRGNVFMTDAEAERLVTAATELSANS